VFLTAIAKDAEFGRRGVVCEGGCYRVIEQRKREVKHDEVFGWAGNKSGRDQFAVGIARK